MNTTTSSTTIQRRLAGLWESMGMLAIFILLLIGVSIFVPNFFGAVNLRGLALSVATVGIITCTMLFCLAAGDFDLSVGSVVALAGVLAAVVINHTHSVVLGIGAGVLAGGLVGLINGTVIARLGINALITTLATMQIVRGFSYIVSDGKAVGVGESLAGIGVARTKVIIFTLQGMMAGFAGVILASRMTSGQPATAQGLELQVISACVLGGVSLTGGVGTITGVIVGVLIMGTVQNAMNLLNIAPFYQYVASGSILLAAVLFDRLKRGA